MIRKIVYPIALFAVSFAISYSVFSPDKGVSQKKIISEENPQRECPRQEEAQKTSVPIKPINEKEVKKCHFKSLVKEEVTRPIKMKEDLSESEFSEFELESQRIVNEKKVVEREHYRFEELTQEHKDNRKDYVLRMLYSKVAPSNRYFYGLHFEDYKEVFTFLGDRECHSPTLRRLDNDQRDEVLFFNTNIDRTFKGRASIINKDYIPIQGCFSFEKFPPEYKPSPYYYYEFFTLGIRSFEGFNSFDYGSARVREDRLSNWFYNTCSKAMSLALYKCWLDSSYDMGLVDFFYLTQSDQLLGNFYCKKSNESKWSRIATLEFIRVAECGE